MSAGVVWTCIALSLGLVQDVKGSKQDDGKALMHELLGRKKVLQAEHRELAGEIAALEFEMDRESTAQHARKLAELHVQLDDILDALGRVRERIEQAEFEELEERHARKEREDRDVAEKLRFTDARAQLQEAQAARNALSTELAAIERIKNAQNLQIEQLSRELADRDDQLSSLENRLSVLSVEAAVREGETDQGAVRMTEVLEDVLQRMARNEEMMVRLEARLQAEANAREASMRLAEERSQDALNLYRHVAERLERGDPYGITEPRADSRSGAAGGGLGRKAESRPRPGLPDTMDPEVRAMLEDLRRVDADLEHQSKALGQQARGAQSEEAREDLTAALRDILEQQFRVRLEIREAEIHSLEKRIDELREEFEERAQQQDRLIERRMEDLTGDRKGSW